MCPDVTQSHPSSEKPHTKLQADCGDFDTGSHSAVVAILELTM